ncbi:hypothetical protein JTE90_019293 [Oedothorax gibbosus]|uniref:Uncharacterized protein n=1 Tax=Oedothorax gibbosus TaxID=931172 RepID=A0AAV6UVP6_9ARAC|nr:hypothetical protein JTE90_019293 [Oedothorax gibbosus]
MEFSKTDAAALELSTIIEKLSVENCENVEILDKGLKSPSMIMKKMFPKNSPKLETKRIRASIDPSIIDSVAGLNIYDRQVLTMSEVDRITCYYPGLDKLNPSTCAEQKFDDSFENGEPYENGVTNKNIPDNLKGSASIQNSTKGKDLNTEDLKSKDSISNSSHLSPCCLKMWSVIKEQLNDDTEYEPKKTRNDQDSSEDEVQEQITIDDAHVNLSQDESENQGERISTVTLNDLNYNSTADSKEQDNSSHEILKDYDQNSYFPMTISTEKSKIRSNSDIQNEESAQQEESEDQKISNVKFGDLNSNFTITIDSKNNDNINHDSSDFLLASLNEDESYLTSSVQVNSLENEDSLLSPNGNPKKKVSILKRLFSRNRN